MKTHNFSGHSLLLSLAFILAFFSPATAQGDRNVLVVGIDGLRGDAFMAAPTPNLDGFMNTGEYTYDSDAGLKTTHGPGWASILTGVWHKKHGVKSNDFEKYTPGEFPALTHYLQDADLRTATVVKWEALTEHIDCCSDKQFTGATDEQVKSKALEIIAADEADVLFVQLGDVDEAGHLSSYSPENSVYLKSITRMDKVFAELLTAVQEHARTSGEEWLIFVCSDHGGEGSEHEGKQKLREVRMVPKIASFCHANGKTGIDHTEFYVSLSEAANVRIMPTVLEYLGVTVPAELDGSSYLQPLSTTKTGW